MVIDVNLAITANLVNMENHAKMEVFHKAYNQTVLVNVLMVLEARIVSIWIAK